MNPDATQPTQALSFLCQRHRGLFFHFFLVFFFFPLFLDFIFLTLSTSFLSPGSPIVTTEDLLCLLVILFQDHFDFSLVETSSSGSEKKKSLYSVLQSQHQYLSVIGSSESILCLPTQSLYTHVFPAQKSIWAEGKDCKEYFNC